MQKMAANSPTATRLGPSARPWSKTVCSKRHACHPKQTYQNSLECTRWQPTHPLRRSWGGWPGRGAAQRPGPAGAQGKQAFEFPLTNRFMHYKEQRGLTIARPWRRTTSRACSGGKHASFVLNTQNNAFETKKRKVEPAGQAMAQVLRAGKKLATSGLHLKL